MYSSLTLLKKYFQYLLKASNGKGHGVHSPFVYAFIKNVLNTNIPYAKNMIFVVPIYDIQNPETTPFVRLTSCGMIQTIKFKPDESLYFTVILPNGDIFETTLPEYFSPSEPNQISQVSALFRYKRI